MGLRHRAVGFFSLSGRSVLFSVMPAGYADSHEYYAWAPGKLMPKLAYPI